MEIILIIFLITAAISYHYLWKTPYLFPLFYIFFSIFFLYSDFNLEVFNLILSPTKLYLGLGIFVLLSKILSNKERFCTRLKTYYPIIIFHLSIGLIACLFNYLLHGLFPTTFIKYWIFTSWGLLGFLIPLTPNTSKDIIQKFSFLGVISILILAPHSIHYFILTLTSISRASVGGIPIEITSQMGLIPLAFSENHLLVQKGWFFLNSPSTHKILLLLTGFLTTFTIGYYKTPFKKIKMLYLSFFLLSFIIIYINDILSTQLVYAFAFFQITVLSIIYKKLTKSNLLPRFPSVIVFIFFLFISWIFVNPLSIAPGVSPILDRLKVQVLKDMKPTHNFRNDEHYVLNSIDGGNRISLAITAINQFTPTRLLKGIGYPKNSIFTNIPDKRKLTFFTAHCFLIDWFLAFGVFLGTVLSYIFWTPIAIILFIVFIKRSLLQKIPKEEILFWPFFFVFSFLISFEGIYGFNPHDMAASLFMLAIFIRLLKKYNKERQ